MNKTISIALLISSIGCIAPQTHAAELCTEPQQCNQKCAGLPSGYINAGNSNNFKYEDCLTACNNTYWDLQNQFLACVARINAAQQQQNQTPTPPTPQPAPEPESQSIYKPNQDLQKELETPSLPVSPPKELNPPAPLIFNDVPDVEILKSEDLPNNGEPIQATTKPIRISMPNGTIDVKPGSKIQKIDNNVWSAVSGSFRFLIQRLANRKFEVRNTTAVAAVRGTQFTTDTTTDEKMTVRVYKGTVDVMGNANKRHVQVHAGYQVAVNKGIAGKPSRITSKDAWFNDIKPTADVIEHSWKTVQSTDTFTRECVTVAKSANAAQTLTADEQKILASFNSALTKFRVKNSDSVITKEKLLSTAKEKQTISSSKSGIIYVDPTYITYPGATKGSWKRFSDPNMSTVFFNVAKEQNIPFGIDKSSLTFGSWTNGQNGRSALYTGTFNQQGNDNFIKSALGADLVSGQDLATVKINVDEETGLWDSYEATTNIKSGKIRFPLVETCKLRYNEAVRIQPPKTAKNIDKNIGAQEMMALIQSIQ